MHLIILLNIQNSVGYEILDTLFSLNDKEISCGMLLNIVESICSIPLHDMFKLLIVLDISVSADVGIATNWLWERSTDSTFVDWN